MIYKSRKIHRGFIATSTVLVLMVVTLSIMMTVSLLGIGEMQGAMAQTNGEQILALTEGCVEEALLGVKNSNGYTGGVISRPEGSCLVTINSHVANDWILTIENTGTSFVKVIRTEISRSGNVLMGKWQEI